MRAQKCKAGEKRKRKEAAGRYREMVMIYENWVRSRKGNCGRLVNQPPGLIPTELV
jgi:hypothetical protein